MIEMCIVCLMNLVVVHRCGDIVCMLLIINRISKPSYITQCLLTLNLDFDLSKLD